LGATSWPLVVSTRLRISPGEARRRLDDAEDLGPRAAIGGQPLPPVRPHTAHAQAAGKIGAEHVHIIRRFFADLPDAAESNILPRDELKFGAYTRVTATTVQRTNMELWRTLAVIGLGVLLFEWWWYHRRTV